MLARYLFTSSKGQTKGYPRATDGIEDLLSLLANALALLRIPLLHLAYGLLLPRFDSVHVYLGDAGQSALEARCRARSPFTHADELEIEDVGKGNDVVIARLACEQSGRVRRGRCRVDGNSIGDVACREKSALEHLVMGGASDLDTARL